MVIDTGVKPPLKGRGVPEGCPLTRNQLGLVAMFAEGKSYRSIAAETNRAVSTIGSHAKIICDRLGVNNTVQAAFLCWKNGWIYINDVDMTSEPITSDDEIQLQAAHRVYLEAFDLHLKSRTDEERIATRKIMDRALYPLAREYKIPTENRPKGDLVESLVNVIRHQREGKRNGSN